MLLAYHSGYAPRDRISRKKCGWLEYVENPSNHPSQKKIPFIIHVNLFWHHTVTISPGDNLPISRYLQSTSRIPFHYPDGVTKIHFIARFDDFYWGVLMEHFTDSEFLGKTEFWPPEISTGNLWQHFSFNVYGTRNSNIALVLPHGVLILSWKLKMISIES